MLQSSIQWQPTASKENLQLRARILQSIRAFFAQREVLEVETPIMSAATITDPQLHSLKTEFSQQAYYLQTSPEFYMKRLLAAGYGDIYQLARVFRDDELGAYHRPEFTLLEWYRLNFDHHQLMDELGVLIRYLFDKPDLDIKKISYQQLFQQQLQIDPLNISAMDLYAYMQQQGIEIPVGIDTHDKDMLLDWLMLEKVSPSIEGFCFLYNYPASQAALARLDNTDTRVANRFELFYGDLELANGFYELTDAQEQAQRFADENRQRQNMGKPLMPIDQKLLDALAAGLPECSGVALGIDRLLMLLADTKNIHQVIGFANELSTN